MNFKIGDKVKFLNEKGHGTVVKFLNKTTVKVALEDGFAIPYAIAQLILISENAGEKIQRLKTISVIAKPKVLVEEARAGAVFVAFSREENNNSKNNFNVWLINQTAQKIVLTFSFLEEMKYKSLEPLIVNSFDSILFLTINKTELETMSDIKVDILFYDTNSHNAIPPVSKLLNFKVVKLYKENAFKECKYIDCNAYMIEVYSLVKNNKTNSVFSTAELNEKLFQKKTNKISIPHTKNNLIYDEEIDIHIEELMDDYSHLSNTEIVAIQINHFQNALDDALSEGCRTLTVIHGVGNGKLKSEIRKIINDVYELNYRDAPFQKYGVGATVVIL